VRSFTWPPLSRSPLSLPKAYSPRRVAANAPRSRRLSEFGARAGNNDDLVFVTSDSISIFLATIVSSDPYLMGSPKESSGNEEMPLAILAAIALPDRVPFLLENAGREKRGQSVNLAV
jgi:hypothetical protein